MGRSQRGRTRSSQIRRNCTKFGTDLLDESNRGERDRMDSVTIRERSRAIGLRKVCYDILRLFSYIVLGATRSNVEIFI